MSEEERLQLEQELLLTCSKAQAINKYIDELEENTQLKSVLKEIREYLKSIENEPDADMYLMIGEYKEYKHLLELIDKGIGENK